MPAFSTFLVADSPSFSDLPVSVQLRKLIEAHTTMTASYGRCYRAVSNILEHYRRLPENAGGPRSRGELVEAATAVRDFVPRFYRWAIQALELSANELAPGTYPTDVPPTQSMDWDEFNRAFKEWLDLLGRMAKYEREYGDLDGFDPYAGQAGREMDRGRSTMEGVGY